MLRNLRTQLAHFLAPWQFEALAEKERAIDVTVQNRVAALLMQVDPFEAVMRQYHGVFSEEFERPETRLSEPSKLQLEMWAYAARDDPSFNFLVDWIMDTQGNATLKKGNPTPETILYGRAQISNMLLFKREVGRIASLHEERIGPKSEFNRDLVVE